MTHKNKSKNYESSIAIIMVWWQTHCSFTVTITNLRCIIEIEVYKN
jgi:hypothetical protein